MTRREIETTATPQLEERLRLIAASETKLEAKLEHADPTSQLAVQAQRELTRLEAEQTMIEQELEARAHDRAQLEGGGHPSQGAT